MKQTTKVSCPTCPKMRRVDENFDGHSLVSNTHALYLVRKMKEQIKPTDTNKSVDYNVKIDNMTY